MTDERTVELISVTKRFGTTAAVDSVSLKIPGGACCCLLGPSGWAVRDTRLLQAA